MDHRFLVVGTPRSGSTWLVESLNTHPSLMCQGELLDDPYLKGHPFFRAYPWQHIQAYWALAKLARKKCGFKLFYFHCFDKYKEHQHIWDKLQADRDIRIIFLTRENLLELTVSLIKAHGTSVYHVRGDTKYDSPPMTIEEGQLRYWFDHLRNGMQRLEGTFADHPQMRITYEELFRDTAATMDSITQFLGVKPAQLNCNTIKQESRPMKDAIANYANLEKKFRNTEYRRYFEA